MYPCSTLPLNPRSSLYGHPRARDSVVIACVLVGNRYPVEYVYKLRNSVARYLDGAWDFVCYSDRIIDGIKTIDVTNYRLEGWWAKMSLFNPIHRIGKRLVYFDLDTVIIDRLEPLINWNCKFGICRNFTKLGGNFEWPCNYGSCVMSINDSFGGDIWRNFWNRRNEMIEECPRGDQQAIEKLYPNAMCFQDFLPKDYFIHYKNLTDEKPKSSVVIFGGKTKPHNTKFQWAKEAWQ